jgi:hypothetical protein
LFCAAAAAAANFWQVHLRIFWPAIETKTTSSRVRTCNRCVGTATKWRSIHWWCLRSGARVTRSQSYDF